MTIAISIVLPAYNEAVRLPPYLTAIRAYWEQQSLPYEVVVVDDGSRDGLAELLSSLAAQWQALKVLRHPRNRGKGAAVRTGMLAANGQLLLFADADGATPIDQERRLRTAIDAGADVSIGSRRVPAPDVTRHRTLVRGLIGRGFVWAARRLLRLPYLDTQCGFKMFRREAGRRLCQLSREQGYLLDLELLLLAERLGFRVVEVPIQWADVPGSRLRMSREWSRILVGLWRLRRRDITLPME